MRKKTTSSQYRENAKKKGWKRKEFYVTEEEHIFLRAALARYRLAILKGE